MLVYWGLLLKMHWNIFKWRSRDSYWDVLQILQTTKIFKSPARAISDWYPFSIKMCLQSISQMHKHHCFHSEPVRCGFQTIIICSSEDVCLPPSETLKRWFFSGCALTLMRTFRAKQTLQPVLAYLHVILCILNGVRCWYYVISWRLIRHHWR